MPQGQGYFRVCGKNQVRRDAAAGRAWMSSDQLPARANRPRPLSFAASQAVCRGIPVSGGISCTQVIARSVVIETSVHVSRMVKPAGGDARRFRVSVSHSSLRVHGCEPFADHPVGVGRAGGGGDRVAAFSRNRQPTLANAKQRR